MRDRSVVCGESATRARRIGRVNAGVRRGTRRARLDGMATKHTHPMVFGRREVDCPRCVELNAGAPVVRWNTRKRDEEKRTLAAIASHDFKACAEKRGCCTCFDY